MAPPPEYDKEPKAPDKSATNIPCEDSKVLYNLVNEHQTNSDTKSTYSTANAEVENNKHVETLDDGQLRALLDEAITYKCPKDREGKSSLFKELLEEVEQDEQACEAAARLPGRARRGAGAGAGGARGRRALPHSNSLQDLVAALAAEPAPRRKHHAHAPQPPVSARAIHGGSLPSGVDTSFLLSEEPMRGAVMGGGGGGSGSGSGAALGAGAEYVATVRCVNPSPLAERRVSTSDAHPPIDTDNTARRSKPAFPMTYTARATLEIGSGSVGSGRAVTTTTASNQVDSAIPFSCITTPEVVASCTTTASAQAPAPIDTKMGRSALTSSFASHGGPLPRAGPAFSAAAAVAVAAAEEFKKSLDENGNSLQGFSSPQSGSSQQKKQRRKKSSKNETVIKPQEIDGYQGHKDINEVLRFIESAEPERAERPSKRHDDKKKRSAERRKDKPPRASSLDGLRAPAPPARPARPARPAAAPAKPERRSWGDDARDYFRDRDPEPDALELTDFQTVTKKRKPRRRADHEPRDRDRPRPQDAAADPDPDPDPDPPSPDRSNDSNDDMDSVHSLPALPSRARPPQPAPVSYADIARTRHNNIPDLIESCNYYGEGEEPPPAAPGDALAYPALEARRRPLKQAHPPPVRRAGKPQEPVEPVEPPPPPPPAPDVVADRRPPVILLDAPARARDLDGVTFGFDVNEQLLGGARRPRCDLVRDAAAAEPPPSLPALPALPVLTARRAPPPLRYVPPAPPDDTHHLHQIIDYVGTAWEEVVRCGGKVRYFSE